MNKADATDCITGWLTCCTGSYDALIRSAFVITQQYELTVFSRGWVSRGKQLAGVNHVLTERPVTMQSIRYSGGHNATTKSHAAASDAAAERRLERRKVLIEAVNLRKMFRELERY